MDSCPRGFAIHTTIPSPSGVDEICGPFFAGLLEEKKKYEQNVGETIVVWRKENGI